MQSHGNYMDIINIYTCILFVIVAICKQIHEANGYEREMTGLYECGNNWCVCDGTSAFCSGENKSLLYIPNLPKNTNSLQVFDNNLPVINRASFWNVSSIKLKLKMLYWKNNNAKHITSDAFKQLKFLKTLWITNEPELELNELANAFSSLNKGTIESIHLRQMGFSIIHEETFANLHGSQLKVVDLAINDIRDMDVRTFSGLKYLSQLNLESNGLTSLKMTILHNLSWLTVNNNGLSDIPNFCDKLNGSYVPALASLELGYNKISYLKTGSTQCIPNLFSLSLDNNPIITIHNNFISSVKYLNFLDLSHVGPFPVYGNVKVENYALNSSSLWTLRYNGQDLTIYAPKDYDPQHLFKYCPNLRSLQLSNTILPTDETNLHSLFSPLVRLMALDLRNGALTFLPEVISSMTSLERLDLSGNQISSWNGEKVFSNSKILLLSLKRNQIFMINETSFPSSMSLYLQNQSLDLSENPYLCTCQTLASVKWFHKNANILIKYPQNYVCLSPTEVNGLLLKDYNPSPESCREKNTAMLVSIPVSAIALTTVLTVILVYKCRWRLRYGIFLFNNRNNNYERIGGSETFVYAGFVIYSDDDRHWVHNELIHRIEDQEGFRLCIRLRDFDVGKVHVDNIVENMILSEKIFIVLSNNFAKDEWCHFQLLLAETRLLKQNTNALLILMLEEIQSDCLRASLYKVVTERQYVYWSNDETGNNLFWDQALSQIKKSTVVN